ncbi:diaminopimelate decarboxylase [Hutsoniella sourekii]|uniref:diaminopimelate decarboxylase n=1 Tax=Hutsoniella sourekii TaxID=87650 RepID=UPI0004880A53|nr:diaminopimelate decarboxylase [Hutsoniella sourekii]
MKLENYQEIRDGKLYHRHYSYQDIAEQFGTPLYIFDEVSFRERVQAYKKAIQTDYFQTEILFASKSLLTLAIARLIKELDIGQDVVSQGEIYTGLTGGVDPAKMYFHGNNKLDSELEYALHSGVGTIVIDNRQEAQRINDLVEQLQLPAQRVLLRLNPGINAHTHEYIATANDSSKFGENIHDPNIMSIINDIYQAPGLSLVGFHSHIGSQIFDGDSFKKAALVMIDFAHQVEKKLDIRVEELNFGGGFGVYYSEGDQPFDVPEFLPELIEFINQESTDKGLNLQKVTFEPGRSLVNASGSTLYKVGDLKETLGGVNYIFIDGSMNDNIRPALYQAEYEAMLVNKADQPLAKTYTVAGKACESGDKIIENIKLPQAKCGDLLLVNGTGAYNYTMASNYNQIPKPAMIHVQDDQIVETVKRQSFADLIANHI